MIGRGSPAIAVAAHFIERHPDIQSLRLRMLPAKARDKEDEATFTLERMLRHKRGPEVSIAVPQPLNAATLRTAVVGAGDWPMVGLCSQFEMRGGVPMHALLMDFGVAKSPEAEREIGDAIRLIGYTGRLLETTNSYHFYGDDLVDGREWLRFMGKWLLVEKLVDVRFVGHCIIEWISCLRLTGNRAAREPQVIASIRP